MKSTLEWLKVAWLAKLVHGFDAVTGVSLVVAFVIYLRRARTGFRKTETMINRLVVFTIHVGILTSVCGVLALIFVSPVATFYPQTIFFNARAATSFSLYRTPSSLSLFIRVSANVGRLASSRTRLVTNAISSIH